MRDALIAKGLIDPEHPKRSKIIAAYDYCDEHGVRLFQACRFEPKDFRQRRPARPDDPPDKVKDGWVWSVKGVCRAPYRLPELIEAVALERRIFVVEGEKDVLTLARHGINATCNAGGTGKWDQDFAEYLVGADVIVIPDHDVPGRDHAQAVCHSLAGKATRVRMLTLPGLSEKGDVSDWFAAGGTVEAFNALAEAAPEWSDQIPTIRTAFPTHRRPMEQQRLIQSSVEFVAGFQPPDYLVDGLLQRRFIYSFTAKTGGGKTSIMLLLAA